MTRRDVFAAAGVALLLSFQHSACAESAAEAATSAARDFMAESGLSGLSVAVGFADGDTWSAGFGYADVENEVPVDAQLTRFRVGSTAKSMTAMAVAMLYEDGKLDLDAPVQRYVPSFPEKDGVITTRLLAGHLAGIRHYEGDEFLSATAYDTVLDGLAIFADDPLVGPPGHQYSYSTYGYNLISAVVETAAGQPFLDFMSERVFGPLEMTATVADRVVPIISHRSDYYTLQDDELVNAPWVDNSYKWAGGGFLSTSPDLVRFALAHLQERWLQADTVAMMWTPQRTADGEETGYGIGWRVGDDEQGRRVISHTGGSVGGITDMRLYPEQRMAIAVITNTAPASIGDITGEIAELFLSR